MSSAQLAVTPVLHHVVTSLGALPVVGSRTNQRPATPNERRETFCYPSCVKLGMRSVTVLALLAGAAAVNASALTTTIPPSQRLCFFADVDKEGEKIGFYFAVQSGGDFDIDFEVKDPANEQLLDGQRERQGDYIFTANKVGEYSFCFENDMSSFTEKLVDFDIMVESEPRREAPAKASQLSDHTSALEESIYKLKSMLATVERTQKFFHTRENRGFSLVKSTQSKLFWYAVLESLAIVSMAIAQVYILQNFFIGTGRKYRV